MLQMGELKQWIREKSKGGPDEVICGSRPTLSNPNSEELKLRLQERESERERKATF
jgi:hypothetical protein